MHDVAIIALIALPLAGALAANILSQIPRAQHLAWLAPAAGAGLTLVVAWLLRTASFEVTFGNWAPVSVVGMPLILAGNTPGMTIVIALAAVQFATALNRDEWTPRPHHTLSALLFSAMAMVALSNSLTALFVGLGLADILAIATSTLRNRDYRRVLTDAMFYGAANALLVIALVLYAAEGNSLYFPLADIPDRLMGFISVALALRLGLVPLRSTGGQFHDTHWTQLAGTAGSFVVVIKIQSLLTPEFRAWVFALALLTALFTLAMGTISSRRLNQSAAVSAGMAGIITTSALLMQPGIIAAGVAGWLAGVTLLTRVPPGTTTPGRRVQQAGLAIGAACIIGLPLTAGFIARSGVAAVWGDRHLAGATLVASYGAVQMLLTICTLGLLPAIAFRLRPGTSRDTPGATAASLRSPDEAPGERPQEPPGEVVEADVPIPAETPARIARPDRSPVIDWLPSLLAVAALSLHAILFGIAPDLAGGPALAAALDRMGAAGWLTWLISTGLGVLAWRFQWRWLSAFKPIRQIIYDVVSLGWLHTILDGAMLRIGSPLSRASVILESDSGLMFTIIILLIIVLVARPGGP